MTEKPGSPIEAKAARTNYHTHSKYDDGKGTIDEIVQSAIRLGFSHLGFSGHGTNRPQDDWSMSETAQAEYIEQVKAAKEKYKDSLTILLGVEQDSTSPVAKEDFDYIITSLHYQKAPDGTVFSVDESSGTFENALQTLYKGNAEKMIQDYFQQYIEALETLPTDIAGHLDLISKFNEDEKYFSFSNPVYQTWAQKAVQSAIRQGQVIEINTGAMARGYRSLPYPHPQILQYMAQNSARVCINSDCHNPEKLAFGRLEGLRCAKEAGFDQVWILDESGWLPVSIDAQIKNEQLLRNQEQEQTEKKAD